MISLFSKNEYERVRARGFTLIELMVSMGLFSVIITISIGTLLVMIDVNAKAQALYSSSTNLSFALDTISREIRTGYGYYCSTSESITNLPSPSTRQDCTNSPGKFISFTRERDGVQTAFRLNGQHLEQYDAKIPAWIPITSDEDVRIDNFDLTVTNSTLQGSQPTVDIFISGTMNNGLDVDTDFSIQTHVIQRRLDIL